MREQWKDYDLPQSVIINDTEYFFRHDYKSILEVIKPFGCPDLLEEEQIEIAFDRFYIEPDKIKISDMQEAVESMMLFISCNKTNASTKKQKPLYSWDKDLHLIIRPINKVVGHDIRLDNIHWWSFMSYFMEIGESTFATYVSIRDKKNRGKKLDKQEEEIFKNNKDEILLGKKFDAGTTEIQNAIQDEIRDLLRKR